MAGSGKLVREILREATIPASRPIDHARRIGTAIFLGSIGGVILGIGTLKALPSIQQIALGFVAMLVFMAVCLSPWAVKPRGKGSVPVVARVLATKEVPGIRRSKGGGLLVPVVCRPCGVDGTAEASNDEQKGTRDFRAVVAIHNEEAETTIDPPVGTLLPLLQVVEGMCELVTMPDGQVTAEQVELAAFLEAHPKSMRNKASALPLRRGALERVPAWAGVEFWLTALLGAIAGAWAISHL
ncbi:MAG: hypothetical protein IKZ87_09450, partial [Actinomycetaceae bacterium]|nr:hypothetical protein [Actinomycetaceae bacterium]